ncbi:hypothetical protein RJ639_009678 [Escallonia herrerae]|uniref:ALBINO3-like protein 2, chloroplastic n=1 Tax=Escallonia herrerae TaxID=1293975 RepID=A0AA88VPC5_9ASTE|nr:hypothetical protein RJ639_009678 [Escallonia herrerae]
MERVGGGAGSGGREGKHSRDFTSEPGHPGKLLPADGCGANYSCAATSLISQIIAEMATPKLLLSKLLRHSRSTQTIASLYSSSIQSHHAPHFFSPSHAFTVHPLAPHSLSRSFSTRDSEFGDPNPGTDSAATHAEHWVPGFDTSVDGGGGSGTAEVLATISSGGSGESIFPVRALISLLDGYHDLTGFPWLRPSTNGLHVELIGRSGYGMIGNVDDNLFLHNGSQNWPISLAYLAAPKVEENCGVIPKIHTLSAEEVPPPVPPPFSGRSYRDQFKLFMKERRAVGCPSYLWFVAYTSVQLQMPCKRIVISDDSGGGLRGWIPCFILWMTAIRRMALDHHSGFDYKVASCSDILGGALWFKNLTQTPSGVLGLIFPLLIAGLHLTNVQISFHGSSVGKVTDRFGTLLKYYKYYLKFLTLPIFFTSVCVPQGCLVYWLTNGLLNLIQQLCLLHPNIREKLGLPPRVSPLLTAANPQDLAEPGVTSLDPSRKQRFISAHNLAPLELVNVTRDVVLHTSMVGISYSFQLDIYQKGKRESSSPAKMPVIHFCLVFAAYKIINYRLALDKDPECARALLVMGQTLVQEGRHAEATVYLERAITKLLFVGHPADSENVDLLIVASQWAGAACLLQSKKEEGLLHLERVAGLQEPEGPERKAQYYEALVMLASTLYGEGRKAEAAKYFRLAAAYDSAYNSFVEKCENDEDSFVNDLVSSRRKDY